VNIRNLLAAILLMVSLVGINQAQISDDPQSAIKRGNDLFHQQKYEAAIYAYQSVSPDDQAAYARSLYNIGVCYYELWRTEEAISFYQRAIDLKDGRYPMASFALGVALQEQAKLPEAKEAYKQALNASHGQYALAHYTLGLLAADEGNLREAAIHFEEAGKHSGFHEAASHNNFGVMLARMGRLAEAEPQFEKALRKAHGVFEDAAYNLKLCRSLLDQRGEVAEMRITLIGDFFGL
jgi:tetratricopeptide (TPR) repeat protein